MRHARHCRVIVVLLVLGWLPHVTGRCLAAPPARASQGGGCSHCHSSTDDMPLGGGEQEAPVACCFAASGKVIAPAAPSTHAPLVLVSSASWPMPEVSVPAVGPRLAPDLTHDPPAYLSCARLII